MLSIDLLRLRWRESDQRRFDLLISGLRLADRVIPRRTWVATYQLYLWDMRLRHRLGLKIV